MGLIIGLDFDNTIVNYDALLHKLAVERGLIEPEVSESKWDIREYVRRLPEGETQWQVLQAAIYGPNMGQAQEFEGVKQFLSACRTRGARVYIVSHKTQFATYDTTGTNLRDVALEWMQDHRFFDTDGGGFSRNEVFFEGTRREKLERISELGCTHFVDDLEETFLEGTFPATVEKILFAPHAQHLAQPVVTVCGCWEEINDYFSNLEG